MNKSTIIISYLKSFNIKRRDKYNQLNNECNGIHKKRTKQGWA